MSQFRYVERDPELRVRRQRYALCFDPSGKTRPKEFATKPGTGYILHVWKRKS